jgi:hypothetical protein
MIKWITRGVKKLTLLDSCSYGELWKCQLLATMRDEIVLFGGFIKWFFIKIDTYAKKNRKLAKIKTTRGLGANRKDCTNGVIAELALNLKLKENG